LLFLERERWGGGEIPKIPPPPPSPRYLMCNGRIRFEGGSFAIKEELCKYTVIRIGKLILYLLFSCPKHFGVVLVWGDI
jgi:hypothetical protein